MGARTPVKVPSMAGGAAAVVLGLGLLVWGLAPVQGFAPAMDVFGGGSPPEDFGDQISATMDALGARVWADGLGLVLVLGGFVAVSAGKARDKTVEEQVQEAVAARLAGLGVDPPLGEQGAPVLAEVLPGAGARMGLEAPSAHAAPVASVAVAPSPPRSASLCAACGAPKVVGGRICPRCG